MALIALHIAPSLRSDSVGGSDATFASATDLGAAASHKPRPAAALWIQLTSVRSRIVKTMTEPHDVRQLLHNRLPAPFVEWQHSRPSRVAAISPYIDQVMRFIKKFTNKLGAVKENEMDIEMALREALPNAVIHGNHENPHKRIYIACRCQINGEVSITVRDEGDGFDGPAVPVPTDLHRRLLSNGCGIDLMLALMDEVSFEEHGKVVYMRKKLRAAFK